MKEVQEEVREDRAGVRQTPVLKGKWNGNDLIVAIPPVAPQGVPAAVKRDLEPDSSSKLGAAPAPKTTARKPEVRKAPPKETTASPATSAKKEQESAKVQETTKTAETTKPKDSENEVLLSELVLNGRNFYPDSEPRALLRECFASIKSGNSRNPSEIYYLRAQAYIQLQEWNNAINDLTDAIHGTPNKATYYLARAYVHQKIGRTVQAREDLEEARFVDTHLPAKITFGD
jgi:tetratricopeptide (TPR) repeat protein